MKRINDPEGISAQGPTYFYSSGLFQPEFSFSSPLFMTPTREKLRCIPRIVEILFKSGLIDGISQSLVLVDLFT